MINSLDAYQGFLLEEYSNLPLGRYVNFIIIRETGSECIFRTEGSGEPLNRELVSAGLDSKNEAPISRIIISKRKQTAVERRTGREILRSYGLLRISGEECMLNTNAPCEQCVDCWLYGYAVGGGGAQKSRVLTEEAFSILPAAQIIGTKTFNALFDDGTMRHPETGEASTSINSSEYVKPQVHFVDIETLKDVTPAEMVYVTHNILNSHRYGAISSKIGRVKNHLVAIVFSRSEVFSSLEMVQKVYDILAADEQETEHPLATVRVLDAAESAVKELTPEVYGPVEIMAGENLSNYLTEVATILKEPKSFLEDLTRSYPIPAK
jgi:CRISPR-associated protein Csc2